MLAAAPLKGYLPVGWLAALALPWLPLAGGAARRLRAPEARRRLVLMLAGCLLFCLRLPHLPAVGDRIELSGRWRSEPERVAGIFRGGLRDHPGVRIRGLGGDAPADGLPFRGIGWVLPGRSGAEREIRLLAWSADGTESAASVAARATRPTPRERRAATLTRFWPRATRPLARALLLGERGTLPYRARLAFRDAGLAHLLALSGLHIGLFLLLCRGLLTGAGCGVGPAEWILLPLLPLLPWLFGGGPSINRAAAMAAYLLLQRRLGGRPLPFEALSFAAVLELLRSPGSLFGPGFQLSYLATAILIATLARVGPSFGTPLRRAGRLALRGVHISLLCTLATLPVVVTVFRRLPLAGPLWNLAAGPVCAAALCLGWPALPFAATEPSAWLTRPAATAFALLAALADLGGRRWPLVWTALDPPVWTWAAWSLGLRWLLTRRGRAALIALPLMAFPVLWDRLAPFA